MTTSSDQQIVADYSNQLSEYLFGESLNFTPDGWDVSGASVAIAGALGEGINQMFGSWADVAAYKERQYQWADKALADAEVKIGQLSNPASAEAAAIRKAADTTAESLRNMGDRAASGIPSTGASSAANVARAASYAASLAAAAGTVLALGQMASTTYDAAIGETTTHNVMGTAAGAIGGLLAAEATLALGAAALGTALLPAIVTAAAAIGAGYLIGKISQAAYNQWGKNLTDFLNEKGQWWGEAIYDWLHPSKGGFNAAQSWLFPRRDPLTLDLDGDGIETIGTSSTNPVLFDHDGDGVKNGTGWVKPDDGFLVFDRNGNGTIDTGAELFGDSTPLYAGGLAADGFAALAQEDTNQDGVVNNQDANWNSLEVWRDLNQDGVSQADELLTLAQAGVTSFNVNKIANSQVLANGNQIADLGTFTRTDGSSGGMGNVSQMADINLVEDTFHREFTDSIPLAEGVAALPDMQGSGKVRDLHEAASLSSDLQTLLTQYSQATTKAEQLNLMDQMLLAWADTSGMAETMQERAGTDYIIEYQEFGAERKSNFAVDDDSASGSSGSVEGTSPEWAAIVEAWERKLHVLEAFNGRYFFTLPNETQTGASAVTGITYVPPEDSGDGSGVMGPPKLIIRLSQDQINLLNQSYNELVDSAYSSLVMQTRFKPLIDQIELVTDGDGIRLGFENLDQYFDERIVQDAPAGLDELIEFNQQSKAMLGRTAWNGYGLIEHYIRTLPITPELQAFYAESSILISGQANFATSGSSKSEIFIAGDTDDTIRGNLGDDTISGGVGADALYGDGGDDGLLGGDGADNLQSGNGNDTLEGGEGNDTLNGGAFSAYWGTYSGAGNDTYVFGLGDGQDTIYDNDATTSNLDSIQFKAGIAPESVQVSRNGNDLVLKIADTMDQITVHNYFVGDVPASWAIEQIRFADSATVWSSADINAVILSGGIGNDHIQGYATADTLNGSDGNDLLYGRSGDDILNGDSGADTLYGEGGNDTLNGGADSDNLQGGAGDDTLEGSAGDDTLIGGNHDGYWGTYAGAGNDTYVFGLGDGQDTIHDDDTTVDNLDVIQFKSGIAPESVQLSRSGNDLILKIADTTDQITVSRYFAGDALGGWAIEEIRFADSATVWDIADIKSRFLNGGAGNDNIEGYATADTLNGNDGNDLLYGRDGDDALNGDAGADTLRGGNGNDALNGGTDGDNLQGGAGNDTLEGGAGNDTLIGGTHDGYWNTFYGPGNDTYVFGLGDGQDTIYDDDATAGNVDVIQFKAGVAPESVQAKRVGENLVLTIADTADQVTVVNYFISDAASGWAIEEIRFADSTAVWTVADIKMMTATNGTAGNDTLTGYATADTINGADGNDILYGRDGNDTLNGDAGADTLHGENGNDTLNGGIGGDTLLGGNGDDGLFGAADADNLQGGAGNDILEGGAGNDTLNGGTYSAYWGTYSGVGNDTYVFGLGDGQDTIYDNDTTAGNQDVIQFKAGIAPESVQVSRNSNNLVLKIAGTTDQITVHNYFVGDVPNSWMIEQIRFADSATVWSSDDINAVVLNGGAGNDTLQGYATADTLNGADGNDTLYGRDGNDTLNGGAGADTLRGEGGNDMLNGGADADNLQGGAGNDILEGGAGNDTLIGGTHDGYWNTFYGPGNDTYVFGLGDGQDTIYDDDATAGNVDVIQFKAGIALESVQVSRNNNNLVLKIAGTTDQITVYNYFVGDVPGAWTVEQIRFADSATVWSSADVNAMALNPTAGNDTLIGYATADTINGADGNDILYGRDGNDSLNGDTGADTLHGENGNDTLNGGIGGDTLLGGNGDDGLFGAADADNLQGGTGNDILEGGTGNDTLNGGTYSAYWGTYSGVGNDTYVFGLGDGQDTIYDNDTAAGNLDVIQFKAGIAPESVQISRINDDLILKITGTADQVTVKNYFVGDANSGWAIEEIRFADSATVWTVADIKATVLNGGAGNDKVLGYATADTLTGGDGNDLLYGRDGDDVLNGDTGADTLYGENGNDMLNGSDGNDTLSGAAGTDILQGGAGIDNLSDASGNGLLDGGADNDTLTGGAAQELFIGGSGNDTISTNTGADIIAFNKGDGQDIINGSTGADNTLSLGNGIQYADLLFKKNANDLILAIGSTDQVTLKDWYLTANNPNVANLQMVIEGGADYDAASASQINNKKVVQFDFDGLVAKFDQARAATPTLTSWELSSSLLEFHLNSSDTEAIGGDLTYQYATNGDLSNVSMSPAQAILASTQFGTANQALQSTAALQDLSPRLI
jgi:Ca2+-binding RTX toxin-like protein